MARIIFFLKIYIQTETIFVGTLLGVVKFRHPQRYKDYVLIYFFSSHCSCPCPFSYTRLYIASFTSGINVPTHIQSMEALKNEILTFLLQLIFLIRPITFVYVR